METWFTTCFLYNAGKKYLLLTGRLKRTNMFSAHRMLPIPRTHTENGDAQLANGTLCRFLPSLDLALEGAADSYAAGSGCWFGWVARNGEIRLKLRPAFVRFPKNSETESCRETPQRGLLTMIIAGGNLRVFVSVFIIVEGKEKRIILLGIFSKFFLFSPASPTIVYVAGFILFAPLLTV
ncbi:MAG: hypothetical protein Q4D98_04940 [Planctomycetia bacterium]|nr:hypothetical protein [Planctomycetia bacterium]